MNAEAKLCTQGQQEASSPTVETRVKARESRGDIRIIPNEELLKILERAEVRDRALIATILVTKLSIDFLRSIKTSEYTINPDGSGRFNSDSFELDVKKELACLINPYAKQSKDSEYLFSNQRKKDGAISRQRIFQILEKYKKSIGLESLNYSSIRTTGAKLFGVPTYPTHPSRD